MDGYRVITDAGRPAQGHLTFHTSPIPTDVIEKPQIRSGIAFVLGTGLAGPGVTVADAVRAVDFVLPALEIGESGVVLGTTPTALTGVDLRLAGCVVTRNGEIAQTGAGGTVLGSPVHALTWLANTGLALGPGQVVVAGSLTRPVDAAPGDTVTVTIAGLGTVTVRLEGS